MKKQETAKSRSGGAEGLDKVKRAVGLPLLRRVLTPASNLPAQAMNATRHGVFAFLNRKVIPPCRNCPVTVRQECPRYRPDKQDCAIAEIYGERMLGWLRNHEWITDSDIGACLELIWAELALWLCDRVSPEQSNEHVARVRHRALSTKLVLLKELGLTPMSRRALGLSVIDVGEQPRLAEILSVARAEREAGAEDETTPGPDVATGEGEPR